MGCSIPWVGHRGITLGQLRTFARKARRQMAKIYPDMPWDNFTVAQSLGHNEVTVACCCSVARDEIFIELVRSMCRVACSTAFQVVFCACFSTVRCSSILMRFWTAFLVFCHGSSFCFQIMRWNSCSCSIWLCILMINESWLSIHPKNIRICEHVIKKETEKRRCSYVELVADGPQIPDYCALTLCDFTGPLLTGSVKYLYPDLTCFDQMIWRMKVCDIMYSTINIPEQRTFFLCCKNFLL